MAEKNLGLVEEGELSQEDKEKKVESLYEMIQKYILSGELDNNVLKRATQLSKLAHMESEAGDGIDREIELLAEVLKMLRLSEDPHVTHLEFPKVTEKELPKIRFESLDKDSAEELEELISEIKEFLYRFFIFDDFEVHGFTTDKIGERSQWKYEELDSDLLSYYQEQSKLRKNGTEEALLAATRFIPKILKTKLRSSETISHFQKKYFGNLSSPELYDKQSTERKVQIMKRLDKLLIIFLKEVSEYLEQKTNPVLVEAAEDFSSQAEKALRA